MPPSCKGWRQRAVSAGFGLRQGPDLHQALGVEAAGKGNLAPQRIEVQRAPAALHSRQHLRAHALPRAAMCRTGLLSMQGIRQQCEYAQMQSSLPVAWRVMQLPPLGCESTCMVQSCEVLRGTFTATCLPRQVASNTLPKPPWPCSHAQQHLMSSNLMNVNQARRIALMCQCDTCACMHLLPQRAAANLCPC